MRQCPSCRTINSFTSPVCDHCGLKFYKASGARLNNLTGTCLRIGGGAILLAVAAAVILRLA